MSVPLKDASVGGESFKTEIVKVNSITLTKKEDSVEVRGEYTFEYPYMVEILDMNGNILLMEKTEATLYTQNWLKKFYPDKNGYVRFGWKQTLLALCKIFEARSGKNLFDLAAEEGMIIKKKGKETLNVNYFEGKEFDAVTIETKDGEGKFIDWVRTLQVAGVKVPTIEDLGGTSKVEIAQNDTQSEVDPDDIPF